MNISRKNVITQISKIFNKEVTKNIKIIEILFSFYE